MEASLIKRRVVVLEILLNYLRKMRRKHSVKDSTSAIEIDLSEYQSEEGVLLPKFTVNGQDIFTDDLQILKDERKWLS